MGRNLLGVGTSVSRDKGYDPVDTITFAADKGFPVAQIYLNDDLITNPALIQKIRDDAKEKEIQLTCHFPEPLSKKALQSSLVNAAKELLLYQPENKIILHFDENEKFDDCMEYISDLFQNDLIVCLENHHIRRDTKSVANNIKTFSSIFTVARNNGLTISPVIDLPRLFISGIIEDINALLATKQILDKLSLMSYKVILHLIDFTDYDQNRDSWCAIGKGLMPYKALFDFVQEIDLEIDHCILEYEDKELCLNSVNAANGFLSGSHQFD